MARIRGNFVTGTLTAGIGSEATSITSAGLANLPAVGGGDVAYLTLDPFQDAGAPEIVVVTAHTEGATVATILRGQEGTAARAHGDNTIIINGVIASDLSLLEGSLSSIIAAPGSALSTAPGATLSVGQVAGTGSSNAVSRADHAHAVPVGSPTPSSVGDSSSTGSSSAFAAADHRHEREAWEDSAGALRPIPNTPSTSGSRGVPGTSSKPARADHTHHIGDGAVIAQMLADSSVVTSKYANNSLTATKIATLTSAVKSTFTPVADDDLTRKGYVDDRVDNGGYGSLADHGSDAGFTRPTTNGAVLWRGVVEPTNAIDGDDWLDLS